jgi:hypothetical protein
MNNIIFKLIIIWLYSPSRALASPFWGFTTITYFYGAGLLVQRPTPNLEDQISVFMTPGDRVTQLYPQTLGTHFSRLLRYAWVTVGLFFNPKHHTGTFLTLIGDKSAAYNSKPVPVLSGT